MNQISFLSDVAPFNLHYLAWTLYSGCIYIECPSTLAVRLLLSLSMSLEPEAVLSVLSTGPGSCDILIINARSFKKLRLLEEKNIYIKSSGIKVDKNAYKGLRRYINRRSKIEETGTIFVKKYN